MIRSQIRSDGLTFYCTVCDKYFLEKNPIILNQEELNKSKQELDDSLFKLDLKYDCEPSDLEDGDG